MLGCTQLHYAQLPLDTCCLLTPYLKRVRYRLADRHRLSFRPRSIERYIT